MLGYFARKADLKRRARDFYGSIVTQSRQETFFARWGVPDTIEGRLEMIALHLAVVLDRLGRVGEAGAALGRALTEAFVTDMDDCMREIGIGDLAVPRKVKRAAAALYDRHQAYSAALRSGDDFALAKALQEAIPAHAGEAALATGPLCHYMRRLEAAMSRHGDADLLAGTVTWPAPAGSPG